VPARELQPVLDRLDLRRFRSEDRRALLDLPRAPLPDPDTPAPVRFLPTFDATLLVHARRTGLLPEEHRPRIFHTKAPQSLPTFLVDGAVAGTWRHERGAIELTPFGRLAADRRARARGRHAPARAARTRGRPHGGGMADQPERRRRAVRLEERRGHEGAAAPTRRS
jgi:Winged helix DNA-binding domain